MLNHTWTSLCMKVYWVDSQVMLCICLRHSTMMHGHLVASRTCCHFRSCVSSLITSWMQDDSSSVLMVDEKEMCMSRRSWSRFVCFALEWYVLYVKSSNSCLVLSFPSPAVYSDCMNYITVNGLIFIVTFQFSWLSF